jgi:hypothetical protein
MFDTAIDKAIDHRFIIDDLQHLCAGIFGHVERFRGF